MTEITREGCKILYYQPNYKVRFINLSEITLTKNQANIYLITRVIFPDWLLQDEILAVAEKMVLRADDLVPLIADHVVWTRGRQLYIDDEIDEDDSTEKFRYDFSMNNRGLNLTDVEQEKKAIGMTYIEQGVCETLCPQR